jgi:hypothetical protein
MAIGGTLTQDALKLAFNRTYKATPDYSVIKKFKVGTGSTTPTQNDTNLENPVNINGGQTKDFEPTYPILDEVNKEITIRCRLASTEANGNLLTEVGLFNTDGSPLMECRDVYTSISKSDTDEVVYIIKNKMVLD